ncbi:hypothetical protein CEXT_314561 [Caerostris extrusa]|uniref:Uncharacterized protein n=1 Tax=Caerostris extrusa TaxID=172846 RepID=A0AAV4Y7W0_CAEEX|nr:hypothetical protein CEXT_314561 [Caerostris extrusa]
MQGRFSSQEAIPSPFQGQFVPIPCVLYYARQVLLLEGNTVPSPTVRDYLSYAMCPIPCEAGTPLRWRYRPLSICQGLFVLYQGFSSQKAIEDRGQKRGYHSIVLVSFLF